MVLTSDIDPATLHDAPSASQLIEAVREFIEGDVMAATEGRVQFHARVAARALAIVERELADPGAVDRHQSLLQSIGLDSDEQLAAAIRADVVGDLEGVAPERLAPYVIWRSVLDKVRVANPGYLRPEDRLPDA